MNHANAISYFEDLMRQATAAQRDMGLPQQQMIPGTGPIGGVVQDTMLGLPTGELAQMYQNPPQAPPQASAGPNLLEEWLRRRQRQDTFRGIGETVDQIGSAFDQRLGNIVVPPSNVAPWRPNPNPGIAGMVQQLLLASRMR